MLEGLDGRRTNWKKLILKSIRLFICKLATQQKEIFSTINGRCSVFLVVLVGRPRMMIQFKEATALIWPSFLRARKCQRVHQASARDRRLWKRNFWGFRSRWKHWNCLPLLKHPRKWKLLSYLFWIRIPQRMLLPWFLRGLRLVFLQGRKQCLLNNIDSMSPSQNVPTKKRFPNMFLGLLLFTSCFWFQVLWQL